MSSLKRFALLKEKLEGPEAWRLGKLGAGRLEGLDALKAWRLDGQEAWRLPGGLGGLGVRRLPRGLKAWIWKPGGLKALDAWGSFGQA